MESFFSSYSIIRNNFWFATRHVDIVSTRSFSNIDAVALHLYTYISIVYTHYLSNQHFWTFCRESSWTHCSYLPPIQDCHSVWQTGRQTLEDWFRYTARRCTLGKPIDRMGIQVLFTTFFFIASINLMYIFHVYSCTFPFFSSDYQQGLTMKFGKKEEAISFAEKQGKKKRFVR